MRRAFYNSNEYREKQSSLTKRNWELGRFDVLGKSVEKVCFRAACLKNFSTIPSDPKIFCSKNCAATVNNTKRVISEQMKQKISRALLGKPNPLKGVIKIERIKGVCQNPECGSSIVHERWQPRKFCSNACAMAIIGGKPTSPKAARAKAGIRADLGDFYFYSRWEANFARLLNFLGIEWLYQPQIFDLGTQRYTPDFYLPKYTLFIEIKNFLSDFSANRDKKFRERYPENKLKMILKDEYLQLQQKFAPLIKNWEYS